MKKILITLLVMILHGCNIEHQSFELLHYDGQGNIVVLPLPEFALPTTTCLKAARFNDQDILYYFNSSKRQILMYDIGSEELIHTIQLNRQGPNEVSRIKGFTIINRDRIMISTFLQKLLTVNLEGEIVDRIDYNLTDDLGNFSRAISLNTHDNNDIYLTKEGYIIPQEPPYRTSDGELIGVTERTGSSVFIEVQGSDKAFSELKIPEDAVYNLHENSILFLTSTFVNGTLYWAYRTDMDIYYSMDLATAKKIEIENPMPRDSRDPQSLGLIGSTARMTLYKSLLYDHYRNKFYRMVRYGIENPDEMYGQEEIFVARYPVKFSIFVFDGDLNPVKEVRFEGTKYDFNRYFISSDGFYLSLNNPENPDFDEDYLRFERIEL